MNTKIIDYNIRGNVVGFYLGNDYTNPPEDKNDEYADVPFNFDTEVYTIDSILALSEPYLFSEKIQK